MSDSAVETFVIPTITVNDDGLSVFSEERFPASWRGHMLLSEQIAAVNLRLRSSEAGYTSDWHVAGDPTLIIILSGCLRIMLRDGSFMDFSAGDRFIAKDSLLAGCEFDSRSSGHRAETIGEQALNAIHIKLRDLSI